LRVAWVQFKLPEKQAKQEVVFPVCVRRRDYIGGVQLSLQLVDYSLSFAEGAEPVPLPLNLQTTVANSTVKVVAFP
jgi:hypothetical protein